MEKLLKLLNLTGSPNDNEALSALRKASALMAEMNLSWDILLNKSYTPPKAAPNTGWGYAPPQTSKYDPSQDPMNKMEELKQYTMPFGKYKGRNLAHIRTIDPDYLDWAYDNMKNDVGDKIREFVDL